ncbi:MAG: hypothetical protein JWL76_1044 [Thermoleophilia bacterium]|nr:hypothetical protein [Thermoleophilia bacterium]
MSLLNDITAVVGNRSPYGANGQQPTLGPGATPGGPSAASQVASRFGTVFQHEFSDTMATVYQRGASGEFDDRSLALQEQAALQRLRVAQQAATPVSTGGVPGGADGSTGAGTDPGNGIGGERPGGVTGGGDTGGTTTGTTQGSNAAPDANSIAVAEQRELYEVRVRQSEARLKNISASLVTDFPLATKLVSASTGTWDPETFQPQTREQAEALAQRLVIDATEAAARLEIVKTQLDSAKFELSQGGGADVAKLVTDLEAGYERQKAYVDKLAKVVDSKSSGQMTAAGEDALAGNTMRGTSDLPVDEIVAALRAEGATDAEIKRVVGAMETSVEQEKTPGGSVRLKSMASEMTRTLVADFNRRMDRMREDGRRREEQRAEERRIDDKRADKKRADQQMSEQRAEQRRAEQDAAWQQWLASLASQHSQQQAG